MPRCARLRRFERLPRVVQLVGFSEGALSLIAGSIERAFPETRFASGVTRLNERFEEALTVVWDPPEPDGIDDFCALLTEHVTIDDSLDESYALDYHQKEDEFDDLVRTTIGEERHRAKFQASAPDRERIVERLATFIGRHPVYAHATYVGGVPPHEMGSSGGLARVLAAAVAPRCGIAEVRIERRSTREQQKNIDHEDRAQGTLLRQRNQDGSMVCPETLQGGVIVVDDLYGSGATMREAGRAAYEAGAERVLGLAVTKQLKFTKY